MQELEQRIFITSQTLSQVPSEVAAIANYWKDEADFYGDRGSCVLGAGFEFEYDGEQYFMPPLTRWQGSVSWEHCKDEIQALLETLGATSIQYQWGNLD